VDSSDAVLLLPNRELEIEGAKEESGGGGEGSEVVVVVRGAAAGDVEPCLEEEEGRGLIARSVRRGS
jgi:hypothetical protein